MNLFVYVYKNYTKNCRIYIHPISITLFALQSVNYKFSFEANQILFSVNFISAFNSLVVSKVHYSPVDTSNRTQIEDT